MAFVVLANQSTDGALTELAKVIVEMADGAMDRAIQRMIGGECQRADLLDGCEELLLGVTGDVLHRGNPGRLVCGEDVVSGPERLARIDVQALLVTHDALRRPQRLSPTGKT